MGLLDWAALLGNLGEFIGSIAVLLTLVYLTIQVRHGRQLLERNERLALGQAFQARVDGRRELEKLVIELAEPVTLARSGGFAKLSSSDQLKVRQLCSLWADWWENNLYQASLGYVSATEVKITVEQIEGALRMWAEAGVEPGERLQEWYAQKKRQPTSV